MNCDELFRFKRNGKTGGYILAEYLHKNDTAITSVDIPTEHNGEPVSAVGDNAFSYSENLKSVTIPSTVKYLGGNAFRGCISLQKIVLPDSISEVGKGTFADCKSLISVEIDNPILEIAPKMFSGCDMLCAEAIADSMPMFIDENNVGEYVSDYSRYDVARLLVGQERVRMGKVSFLGTIILYDMPKLLPLAEECGLLTDRDFVSWISQECARRGLAECTAWLLEYINRKFGFAKEDKYEL